MTFVKFTGVNGDVIYVAVESISAVRKDQGGTTVHSGRRDFWVREEPDAVLQAIVVADDAQAKKKAEIAARATTQGKA